MILNRRLLPIAELASVLLTLSIVVGFRRLFVDDSFVAPLVVVALVTHGLSIALRRAGRGLSLTAFVTLLALTGLVTVQHYSDTARAFLPSGESRAALRVDLRAAWDTFGEVAAPTEVLTGFVVFASIGIWLCAFMVDWAAFRLNSKIETLLPPAALFGFQSVVGGDRARVASAACFGAAAIFFVLAHRVCGIERDGRWLNETDGSGHLALLRGGAVISVIAILVGLGVGPLLPGADDEALVQLDASDRGDGTRFVDNPFVDIRATLLDLSDEVMFTVTTTSTPEYWRMLSLDEFTGEQWRTSDTYVDADAGSVLDSDRPSTLGAEEINQQITVFGLTSSWLPAAYEANRVVAPDFTPNWSPNTGALLMPKDRLLEQGDYYTVVSQIPDRDVAAVAGASGDVPAEVADSYLGLPGDFSPRVQDEAQRIIDDAGATTPYQKSLALQNFFLDNFTYDLDVAEGHSDADIEDFVFDVQRGYCEQFSGSFAAMARSVGLPTRVVVGFTPGTRDPDGFYVVRGTDAHAWPEVWFPEAGWVKFEPTPGRGLERDAEITGVPPMDIVESELDPTDAEGVTVPTSQPPPSVTQPARPTPAQGGTASTFVGIRSNSEISPFVIVAAVVAVIAALTALLWLARREHARRNRTTDAPTRVQVSRAWDDALDGLAMTGTAVRPSETANEFSHRAGDRVDDTAGRELAELAQLTTAARYGGDDLPPERGERARELASGIRGYCNAQVTHRRRLAWDLDPRPLFRPRR